MIPILKYKIFSSLSKQANSFENKGRFITKKQITKKTSISPKITLNLPKNKIRVTRLRMKREKQKKVIALFQSIKSLDLMINKLEKNNELDSELAQTYKHTINNFLLTLEQKRRELKV